MEQLTIHPAANAFPMMDKDRYAELLADVGRHGQIEPITVCDGMVLDGRNRYKACMELGIEPKLRTFDGNPWRQAWSLNGQRRDLAELQRGAIHRICMEASDEYEQAQADMQKQIQREANAARAEAAELRRGEGGRLMKPSVCQSCGGAVYDKEVHRCQKPVVEHNDPLQAVDPHKGRAARAKEANVSTATQQRVEVLANNRRDLLEKVASGDITGAEAMRTMKRDQVVASLESVEAMEVKQAAGLYDVMVIDPPWPMQKIERDVTPNQVAFEYPTASVFCQDPQKMDDGGYSSDDDYHNCVEDYTEDEGREEESCGSIECIVGDLLQNNTAKDCHIWIWTTQKYLFDAYELLSERWGLNYVCTFVWHKPGGFQPFDLPQYNCEFALYARKGSPKFIDTKAFPLCFNAPRKEHSAKPEEFYDVVRRVTAGRRLDVFNRRKIDGFDGWGQEAQ